MTSSAGLAKIKLRERLTVEPASTLGLAAYILFEDHGSGEFAFRRSVTGQIFAGGDTVEISWTGDVEMDEAQGDRWAEVQPNGSRKGQIGFQSSGDANFIARCETSSTAG